MIPAYRPPCIVLLLILAALSGLAYGQAAVPASQGSDSAATRPALGVRAVGFSTGDGIQIHGDYVPPRSPDRPGERAPVVMLVHGFGESRSVFSLLVFHLHEAGFAVLSIDLRGHGESKGPPGADLPKRVADRDPKLFRDMYRDVQAAYLWLMEQKEVDPARSAVVGAGTGCSVALNYAARDRSVDGVVCLTPGTNDLGVDSTRDAKKYGPRPLLLVAAEPEREAAEQLGGLAPKSTVQIVPASGSDPEALHGSRMLGRVPGIERAIADFLLATAGPPTTQPVFASLVGELYHAPGSSSLKRIKRENLRQFSSPVEAEARGLRASKQRSKSP